MRPPSRQILAAVLLSFTAPHRADAQDSEFARRVIVSDHDSVLSVTAADIDGDGDVDVLSAAKGDGLGKAGIFLLENIGGDPPQFVEHLISTLGQREVAVADVDLDGDLDVLNGRTQWLENTGGSPPSFTARDYFLGQNSNSSRARDMDGDGDIDIVSAIEGASSSVYWFENLGGSPPTWLGHPLPVPPSSPMSNCLEADVADLDGDGDPDILAVSEQPNNPDSAFNRVVWWENDGQNDPTFLFHEVNSTLRAPLSINAADLDGDLDTDFAVAVVADNRVVWFENDGMTPPGFTLRDISASFSIPFNVQPTDIDGDGDQDVLASSIAGILSLFENDGASPPAWTERVLSNDLAFASDAWAADINDDGNTDVVAGYYGADTVAWFENASLIQNVTMGTTYSSFADAIAAAGPTDMLVASPARFIAELNLDYAGKGLTIASTGPVVQDYRAQYTLADGASLRAAAGAPMEIRGSVVLPPAAAAELEAPGGILFDKSMTVSDGSTLSIDGDTTVQTTRDFDAVVLSEDPDSIAIDFPITGLDGYSDSPEQIEFVDVNGDGLDDVVTADNGSISAYLAVPGDPNAFTATRVALTPGMRFFALKAGDLNGDGTIDIVAYGDDLRVFLNDGQANPVWTGTILYNPSGVFEEAYSQCNLPFVGLGLDIGDLDRDGDPDLVIGTSGTGALWFRNNGADPPVFTLEEFSGSLSSEAQSSSFVGIADMNNDNAADVVLMLGVECLKEHSSFDGPLRILYGSPTTPGTFALSGCLSACSNGCTNFAFGPDYSCYAGSLELNPSTGPAFQIPDKIEIFDYDSDGDLDLGLANFSTATGPDTWAGVRILENLGGLSPAFAVREIDTDLQLGSFASGDFDSDGDPDLLLADRYNNRVGLYESDGAQPPSYVRTYLDTAIAKPSCIRSGDWNGDGILDVSYSGERLDEVKVLVFQDFGALSAIDTGSSILIAGQCDVKRATLEAAAGTIVSVAGGVIVDSEVGVLAGGGTVAADVVNHGVIRPTPGQTLTIDGLLSTTGQIRADLTPLSTGGAPTRITITGNAQLNGALVATASGLLNPATVGAPELLSAASISPDTRFNVALLPSLGSTAFLSVVYEEGGLRAGERGEIDRALATVSLQVNSLTGDIDLDPQAGAESGAAGVPRGATLGDIDGDGDPDLLIALPDAASPNTAPGSVVVLYNADDGNAGNGWEGFGDTLQITAGVGVNPSSVALGAIDADGQPDIVVSNRGTPGNTANDSVSVLLIDDPSAATFALSHTTSFTVGDEPADIIIADLDGDGALDIATANAGSDSVTIAWNFAIGVGPGWVPVTTQPIELPEDDETPVSVRPGDTNAEVFSFLATANSGNNTIGLIQVNPDRSAAVLPNTPAGAGPVEVVVADLNLDGDDDIATVNRNDSSITIVLNTTALSPTLTVGAPSDLPVPTTTSLPRSIAAGDFDNDANGDIDLAILGDGVIKILRNDLFNGQLAFTPIADQPAGVSPLLVRSADLNGDGRDDVVTVAESAGALSLQPSAIADAPRMAPAINILLADLVAPACAADINGDGFTNASDFVILAGNFGASVTPNTDGDLNGDGLVNAADFVILAGDFGCGN